MRRHAPLITIALTIALTIGVTTGIGPAWARTCADMTPFGIALAQPFERSMVSRANRRDRPPTGNVVRYSFKPRTPNPLFDSYTLTTTVVGELTHEVTARRRNCADRCESDFGKLVSGLEAKYGPGTEIHETGTQIQLRSHTYLWTLFLPDCRIRLEVTPPGPLELTYTDFSPVVRQALQRGSAGRPPAPDPDVMEGL